MRALLLILIAVAVGFAGGWFASGKRGLSQPRADLENSERKLLYYQSAMHPWVKSDKPGSCTVCGMALTPIYSDTVSASGEHTTITLSTNTVATLGVRVTLVTRTNLVRPLQVAGRIVESDARRKRLSAYLPGRIEKLHVNFEGAEVTRGAPLVTIYSPLLLEAEREYRLLYRQSQMNHSTKITAEHGRLLDGMRQRLLQYGLTAEQINHLPQKPDTIATSEILSPMDGVVTSQKIVEGQYLEEGQLMFEIVDLYTMWFEFDVYESDLSDLKTGQRVQVTVPASDTPPFSSVVSFINPNLNPIRRSAEVRTEIRNPVVSIQGVRSRTYKREMYAEGLIQLEQANVLAIPRSAVLDDGRSSRVFVESAPGLYEKREVKIGFRGSERWEIRSGLVENEQIAINALALFDSQLKL